MSWGAYWMFYQCQECKLKFRWELANIDSISFGQCPQCNEAGILVGETGKIFKENPQDYMIVE